jgi:hypothetical protein
MLTAAMEQADRKTVRPESRQLCHLKRVKEGCLYDDCQLAIGNQLTRRNICITPGALSPVIGGGNEQNTHSNEKKGTDSLPMPDAVFRNCLLSLSENLGCEGMVGRFSRGLRVAVCPDKCAVWRPTRIQVAWVGLMSAAGVAKDAPYMD